VDEWNSKSERAPFDPWLNFSILTMYRHKILYPAKLMTVSRFFGLAMIANDKRDALSYANHLRDVDCWQN